MTTPCPAPEPHEADCLRTQAAAALSQVEDAFARSVAPTHHHPLRLAGSAR